MNNDLSLHDISVLRHMLKYCQEIEDALVYFGNDEALFRKNAVFRNAVCMPIQQIGELTKHLSDVFIENNTQIPWSQIKGMRDWFAHQYFNMDIEVIWKLLSLIFHRSKLFCSKCLIE